MIKNEYYVLSNGISIPKVGFGTWQITDEKECKDSIKWALEAGYTHIDTANAYRNEKFIGEEIKALGVDRKELFITSKLPAECKGYDITFKKFYETINNLGTDYLDLYLIHAPRPWGDKSDTNFMPLNIESWKAMIELYNEGKIKCIGVSNFSPEEIEELAQATGFYPQVNQIYLHAGVPQAENKEYCDKHNILIEAYCPLGSGRLFSNEDLKALALKNNKTMAQMALRFTLDYGTLPLPKSVHESRIYENIDLDFELSKEDYDALYHLKY